MTAQCTLVPGQMKIILAENIPVNEQTQEALGPAAPPILCARSAPLPRLVTLACNGMLLWLKSTGPVPVGYG